VCFAAILAVTPAVADPSIASKQAEAQSVMGQVQQLDASMERAVEAYDFANAKLEKVRSDLKQNHAELAIAKQSLHRAQSTLAERLVALYTTGGEDRSLEVLLGAANLDDLVNRFNTVNRMSAQDAHVLSQVTVFHHQVKAHEVQLKHAKAAADQLVRERAAARASIENQLSARRALLSSIRGQIATLQRQEAARST
jgi:peptidoglycan hydrolase CwlO-like protein